jgi:glycosyltransferase involved in cell wall biosynthesis
MLKDVIDDLVIIDSGSTDETQQISKHYNVRFIHRSFDNFKAQRTFAMEQCQYKWILFLDSDEVPDDSFIESLKQIKMNNFSVKGYQPDGFKINRRWIVLGKEIGVIYPIESPDQPARMINSDKMSYKNEPRLVHETIAGGKTFELIGGNIFHYPCQTIHELYSKIDLYTTLGVFDLKRKGANSNIISLIIHPVAAWIKWYIFKGGWKDGYVGLILGNYAFQYTYMKYLKLYKENRKKSKNIE